jgi:mannosyltransferase OCH1-like enzyme
MKLTKRQNYEITSLISESLNDVVKGRMIGPEIDLQEESTVDMSVVSLQTQDLAESVARDLHAKLPQILKYAFQRNGLNESISYINDSIEYNHSIVEVQNHFTEKLIELFNEHVNQVAQIVLEDQEDF